MFCFGRQYNIRIILYNIRVIRVRGNLSESGGTIISLELHETRRISQLFIMNFVIKLSAFEKTLQTISKHFLPDYVVEE